MSDDSRTFSELLALAAERDGYKVEWYAGKIVMQASASAFHNLIVSETIRQIPSDAWWALPDMGVGTPGDHRGPQPDIVIIPAGSLSDDENPVRKEIVAAVVEVVSKNTRSEDYGDKPEAYALMRIPVYVIIDRKCETIRVFSEPDGHRYTRESVSSFGKPFTLPEPVLLTIDTGGYPAAL
ncbi:Uma2 family endonuclease [Streptosporangium sp. NBC_01755]|uniref:Uma2 family endonuclease n=1 Tax=unclassified Streptosporangium TaxID=2632669 RepID=UPI002DDA9A12|nr:MULTISPECIES: Uma2 family endonuclease [unclassified Streptosporangium]WSA22813.1 Uma2 family endonuclease [Streptosporangium sp. NBC_01810]WSC99043.1 Uma2 family endonuclease [Streptosporangium sp. NBC_01755]